MKNKTNKMLEPAIINGKNNFVDLGKTGILSDYLLKNSNRKELIWPEKISTNMKYRFWKKNDVLGYDFWMISKDFHSKGYNKVGIDIF